MSHIEKEELQLLKKLCRIQLSHEEERKCLENLKKILNYMDQLKEVDTEGVEPCRHVIPKVAAPLREDEPKRLISRDVFLKGSPSHVGGMVKVPKIIKDQL